MASSIEGEAWAAANATDGNAGTRWGSQFLDGQWIYVDLGSVRPISSVRLVWEDAYAKSYHIQVSNDATSWSTLVTEADSDGGVDVHSLSASGRYVRILGVTRANGYGISLWEFEVY